MADIQSINLREKLTLFDAHCDPKIVAELNGQHVKLVKLLGEFVWHSHENEDELFLVLAGELRIELRDREVRLCEGECVVIPRGVEHKPIAEEETAILMFEPAGTRNTGEVEEKRTLVELPRI